MGTVSAIQSPGPAPGAPAETARRRGLAMLVVMTGVLITAVDTTIVVLALPEIESGLHVALSSVVWVVIGYLLVITLLATQVGRLGDMFGRVRMYEAGFAVFILGSLACALAWNEGSIIAFRILQGIGGAFVTANSGAVIADLFPREQRGKAYGYNAVGWSLGAVLGIVLGGVIVTYISWRWVFWINVPIGAGALLLATRVLHEHAEHVRRRLDPAGMITLGAGLFGVLWATTKLASSSFDATLAGYLIGGLVLLCAFVAIELRHPAPMLALSLFRIPTLTPSLLASFFQGLANYAVLFLVIMYLQGARGLTPIHASLLLHSSLWLVVAASVVNGLGASAFFPANSAAVMKAVPPTVFGTASGMLRTFANIGMVFSFSMAILIASRSISKGLAFAIFVGTTSLHGTLAAAFTTGLHSAFYASVGFMAVAAVLSATRAGRRTRRASPE